MRALKKLVCWMYAVQTVFCLVSVVYFCVPGGHSRYAHVRHSLMGTAAGATFLAGVTCIFAMSFWTMLKGKRSARYWVLFPSISYFGLGVGILYRHPTQILGAMVPLLLGVGGPLVTWHRGAATLAAEQAPLPKISGDGTSNLLNRCAQVFGCVACLGAWWGCNYWTAHNHLPRTYSGIGAILLAGFLSTLVHELGHTTIGLALGMRLRAFVVGPFQARLEEGVWKYKFNPAGLLTDEGATGVVPTSANQPPWRQLLMIAAGPASNLYCGLIAVGFAYAFSTRDDYVAFTYPAALFALYNLISFLVNLIPLRTGTNYSDGAKIYQILAGGRWAALHSSVALVSSSLVTPLEPRDYDMAMLQAACDGIHQGQMGMLLRLWAHQHHLDSGRMAEAAQALQEAEAVFHASVPDLPAPLCTVFVFGHAYVRRDAAAARQWWDRMQAKKPTRFNVDYYRAEAALHWIEGDSEPANTCWARSEELAKKLPHSGAYEFDRTCCKLLRKAMDETPGGKQSVVPTPAAANSYRWAFIHDIPEREPTTAASE